MNKKIKKIIGYLYILSMLSMLVIYVRINNLPEMSHKTDILNEWFIAYRINQLLSLGLILKFYDLIIRREYETI